MPTTGSMADQGLSRQAREITRRELATYAARTTRSQAATDRAQRVLPMGVPSSFQFYDPHPIVAASAERVWLTDVDGHRYLDLNMGFGALFAGHVHPAVRAALSEQLDRGTLFVTPCETNAQVAELLADRFGLPQWRLSYFRPEFSVEFYPSRLGVTGRPEVS